MCWLQKKEILKGGLLSDIGSSAKRIGAGV